jgi:hypothetical protein
LEKKHDEPHRLVESQAHRMTADLYSPSAALIEDCDFLTMARFVTRN